MTPEDIQKLLGGYATGTLTVEEQQALFAAALEDQELFDSLAREQTLRDLLRDPSARAEMLSALDTPNARAGGFWQWLRRPAMVGLAMAGVAAIAIVAVWQGTRGPAAKHAEPVMVAELTRPEAAPAAPAAPVSQPQPTQQTRVADAPAPAPAPRASRRAEAELPAELSKEKQVAAPAAKVAAESTAIVADKKALEAAPQAAPAAAPLPLPLPPPQAVLAMRKGETDAAAPVERQFSGALGGAPPPDARLLFYAGQPVPAANSFAAGSGRPGAASPSLVPEAPRKDATAPRANGIVAGMVAAKAQPVPRLGLRVSILRGDTEVDLASILNPGETVRLKLIPNAGGFLYVEEGARTVASGPVQRMKPFETPELRFEGSGPKVLNVIFSRSPRTAEALSLGALVRDSNLLRTDFAEDHATYIMSGPNQPPPPQIVVPITLTFR